MEENKEKIDLADSKQSSEELKKTIEEFEKVFYKKSLVTTVKRRLRRFGHRVRTVWKFARLGWDDYDWDQYYLLRVLEMKLEGMHDFFESDLVMCEKPEEKAEQIKTALNACHRLVANEYEFEALKPHDEKWGKCNITYEETDAVTKCSRVNFRRENVKTEEDEAQETKEFLECYTKAQKEYQKDADILFDTMKKYHQGWWD